MIGNDGARSDAFHDRSRTWIDLAAPDGYDIRSTDRTCTNSWMNLNYRSTRRRRLPQQPFLTWCARHFDVDV